MPRRHGQNDTMSLLDDLLRRIDEPFVIKPTPPKRKGHPHTAETKARLREINLRRQARKRRQESSADLGVGRASSLAQDTRPRFQTLRRARHDR